jgi:hypothetical protein
MLSWGTTPLSHIHQLGGRSSIFVVEVLVPRPWKTVVDVESRMDGRSSQALELMELHAQRLSSRSCYAMHGLHHITKAVAK